MGAQLRKPVLELQAVWAPRRGRPDRLRDDGRNAEGTAPSGEGSLRGEAAVSLSRNGIDYRSSPAYEIVPISGYRLLTPFEPVNHRPFHLFRHEGPPAAVFDREVQMRHARAAIVNSFLPVCYRQALTRS